MPDQWTRGALLRECMAILKSPSTICRERHLPTNDCSAKVEWDGDSTRIAYDPTQDGAIRAVIHELLHVVLHDFLETHFDSDCEEWVISGLEEGLYKRVAKSPYLMKRWRTALADKVNAPDGEEED